MRTNYLSEDNFILVQKQNSGSHSEINETNPAVHQYYQPSREPSLDLAHVRQNAHIENTPVVGFVRYHHRLAHLFFGPQGNQGAQRPIEVPSPGIRIPQQPFR